MESNYTPEDMAAHMEEMKEEIAALKQLLAEKRDEAADRGRDMKHDIRAMVEEGFAKVSDAIRPFAEKAGHRIADPTKDVVARVEEKIVIHPIAAVMIALGAGLVVGKMIDVATRPVYVERHDS